MAKIFGRALDNKKGGRLETSLNKGRLTEAELYESRIPQAAHQSKHERELDYSNIHDMHTSAGIISKPQKQQ